MENILEQLRLRYSVPVSLVGNIKRGSEVISDLLDCTLDEKEYEQLLKKMFIYWSNRIIGTPQKIAVVLKAFPQCLLVGNNLSIKKAVRKFENLSSSKGGENWKELSDSKDIPMIVEKRFEGGFCLVRLFTRNHFIENSKVLGHCLGGASLDRYHAKSRTGNIQVFSLLHNGIPLVTIIYDGEVKTLTQIKKSGDKLLDGTEYYFGVTMDAIRFLVTTPMVTPSGKYRVLDIMKILDLEELVVRPFAIMSSGELISIQDLNNSNIGLVVGGSVVRVSRELSVETMLVLARCLSLDMTCATAQQRLSLNVLDCSLIDHRQDVDGYDNLTSVGGQVVCTGSGTIIFKTLEHTGRGVYLKKAKKVLLPRVTRIRGRLDIRSATFLCGDNLEEIHGNLNGVLLEKVNLPKLRLLKWNLQISTITMLEHFSPIQHGGKIVRG